MQQDPPSKIKALAIGGANQKGLRSTQLWVWPIPALGPTNGKLTHCTKKTKPDPQSRNTDCLLEQTREDGYDNVGKSIEFWGKIREISNLVEKTQNESGEKKIHALKVE